MIFFARHRSENLTQTSAIHGGVAPRDPPRSQGSG
jgi:hypothetical protein